MSTEFKHIVRVMGKDLDGTENVVHALSQIKGISIRLANAIVKKAGIPLEKHVGLLTESEVRKIGETVKTLADSGLPVWLLNHRKNLETGKDIHLTTSDLDLQLKADIERMKSIRSWRGYRHAYGLRVRGQRTRTGGRKARSVGVKKRVGGPPPVGGP